MSPMSCGGPSPAEVAAYSWRPVEDEDGNVVAFLKHGTAIVGQRLASAVSGMGASPSTWEQLTWLQLRDLEGDVGGDPHSLPGHREVEHIVSPPRWMP